MPGCEKMKDFIGVPLTKCCESLPHIVDKGLYKDCIESCKSKDDFVAKRCCVADCVLKAAKLLNETGYFDFEAAKTALNEKVSNDEKWVEAIKESVETCKTEGSSFIFIESLNFTNSIFSTTKTRGMEKEECTKM